MSTLEENFEIDNKRNKWNNTMQVASTAVSLLNNAYKAANPNLDNIRQSADAYLKSLTPDTNLNSFDDLMGQWSSFRMNDPNSNNYYVGPSNSDIVTNTASSAISGASTGASVGGGWGALIGGVAGIGSGLIGGLIGSQKANKVAEELQKKQNNFDEYRQNLFTTQANNLNMKNNREAAATIAAFGGAIGGYGGDWSNGLNFIKTGGKHSENPFGGVPIGISEEGIPNLVEEGEVVWNNYVFSDRIKVPKEVKKVNGIKGNSDMSFAKAVEYVQKASSERPHDPIEKRTLNSILSNLMVEQETIRQKKEKNKKSKNTFAFGGYPNILYNEFPDEDQLSLGYTKSGPIYENNEPLPLGYVKTGPIYENKPFSTYQKNSDYSLNNNIYNNNSGNSKSKGNNNDGSEGNNILSKDWEPWLRYAPIIGTSIGLGYTIANKPDYKYAKELEQKVNKLSGNITNITPEKLGDYMAYKPFDRLFYANELEAQQAATRRAIMNNSNMNRGAALAGLLASDYNNNIGLGRLLREGDEYNLAQRQKVAEFNRGTNQFNRESDMRAKTINAELNKARTSLLLDAQMKSLGMKQQQDLAWDNNLAANLTGLFDNIGNVGWEAVNRNMINSDKSKYYAIDRNGNVYYKKAYVDASPEEKAKIDAEIENLNNTDNKQLNKKKKKIGEKSNA